MADEINSHILLALEYFSGFRAFWFDVWKTREAVGNVTYTDIVY